MAAPAAREAGKHGAEILARSTIRPFTPQDRAGWTRVAQSAWGIDEINKIWDFAALTEDNVGTCFGIFDGDLMMGGSVGLIKMSPEGAPYLFLHQLAVDKEYQGMSLGNELMQANYKLITEKLSPIVDTLKLNSDPFVATNVNLYLHKSRMHSNQFVQDLYKGIEETGGAEHRDLPSDRFYYEAKPNSAWVKNGVYPGRDEYITYMKAHPEALFLFDPITIKEGEYLANLNPESKFAFVETAVSPSAAKTEWGDETHLWAKQHREVFTELFTKQAHTAVDYVAVPDASGKMRHFIVTVKDFNENDVNCLKQAL